MNLLGNNLLCFVLVILILTIVQFHINFTVVGIIFFSVIIMSEFDAHTHEPHDEEVPEDEDPNIHLNAKNLEEEIEVAEVEDGDGGGVYECATAKFPHQSMSSIIM